MPIEHRVREALDAYVARVHHDMEAHLRRLTADLQVLIAEVQGTERDSRLDTLERLLSTARQIGAADSLSGVLEALMRGASAQTSRVAVMVVDGDHLKVWGHRGFAPGLVPSDMLIGAAGTLAATVALRQSSFVSPLIDGDAQATPAFMRVPVGFTGVVVPLVVGGDVVALLYADDVERTATQDEAPIWSEEVELLARHASVCLQNITAVRTLEVLSHRG